MQNCFTVDSVRIDPVAGHDFYVHWSDETLHDLYELRYGPASADTSTYTVVTTADTAVTLTGFAHDSSYVFLLRALCVYEDTIETWSPWVETHYGIHCEPIGDMTVAMDAEHSALLSWTGAEGYARYEVAYGLADEDETGHTVVTTTDTVLNISGLLYDTLYAFRVRGLCSYEDSTAYWSVWSEAVTGRVPGYAVEGRSNYSPWGTVTGSGVYEAQSVATLTAVPTETGQFIVWGDGEDENPRSLTVESDTLLTAQFAARPPAGIVESDGMEVLLVPNPATREVRIAAATAIRQVTVYDATGRQVALLHPDSAEVTLNVERWAAGTYTLLIATDEGTATRKLVRN
ncbi:MAG: T9SS type A sorting domain-containing protein [Bacteroidales bacterium]|nr:T9SS type A sorting domain-containing protein [Bacteroidales bacterium]